MRLLMTLASRLLGHRTLIWTLAKRELSARYRQSLFGGAWSVLQPIAVVILFYYVFGVIFQMKWGRAESSPGVFIFGMFTGILIYNLFSEGVSRSVAIISGNANYVKKIAFPLAVLPLVQVVYSIANFAIGLLIIFIFGLVTGIIQVNWSLLLIPILILPVIYWSAGMCWFVASSNVYFRDTSVVIPLFLQLILFLSPVFYALEMVPETVQSVLVLSPLSEPITALRNIMTTGELPSLSRWVISFSVSIVVLFSGYLFFRHTAPGFADVL